MKFPSLAELGAFEPRAGEIGFYSYAASFAFYLNVANVALEDYERHDRVHEQINSMISLRVFVLENYHQISLGHLSHERAWCFITGAISSLDSLVALFSLIFFEVPENESEYAATGRGRFHRGMPEVSNEFEVIRTHKTFEHLRETRNRIVHRGYEMTASKDGLAVFRRSSILRDKIEYIGPESVELAEIARWIVAELPEIERTICKNLFGRLRDSGSDVRKVYPHLLIRKNGKWTQDTNFKGESSSLSPIEED